jgi:hypothetical protein
MLTFGDALEPTNATWSVAKTPRQIGLIQGFFAASCLTATVYN